MNSNDRTTSGIENTAERDPLLHLLGSMSDGTSDYITGMEAQGQRQLVGSESLPTRMNSGSDDDLTALGFQLGDPFPNDSMFRPATLPNGWKKQPTDHSMWSKVVDEHGRTRLSIFYKAAFYDRSAFINVNSVAGYVHDVMDNGAPLVLDDGWATADAVRAAAEEIREDYVDRQKRYGDRDSFYSDQIAAVERVLALLPDGA